MLKNFDLNFYVRNRVSLPHKTDPYEKTNLHFL